MADRLVEPELELGDAPQANAAANVAAEERRGALERPRGLLARLRIAKARVEHARQLQVRGHLHARQRDEPDLRIVHRAAGEQLAEFLANLLADSIWTVPLGHCSSRFKIQNSKSAS